MGEPNDEKPQPQEPAADDATAPEEPAADEPAASYYRDEAADASAADEPSESDAADEAPAAGQPTADETAAWPSAGGAAGGGEETEFIRAGDEYIGDETTRLTPEDLQRPEGTMVMPTGAQAPAWSGRAGVPTPPPPGGGLRDSAPYSSPEPPPTRTWWTPLLLGMLALGLVGIVILAAWLINRSNHPAPKPTPTSTPMPQPSNTAVPTTAAASPTATASPTVKLVQVPTNLVGMTQDDATAALDAVGLAYSLEFQTSSHPQGTVISTSPAPGQLVAPQTTVKLLISQGGGSPTPGPTAS